MATNFLYYAGPNSSNSGLLVSTSVTIITTEINNIANGSVATSSVNGNAGVFNAASTGQGIWAEIFWTTGSSAATSTATAGANLTGWFLTSPDNGTTFEPTSSAPARSPDFFIPLLTASVPASVTYKTQGLIRMPALPFKVMIQNNTGQTLPNNSSGTAQAKVQAAYFAIQY